MGVKGLLPCLTGITRSVSLERYRGLTVAVDAMSWLHKGVFACDVKALAKTQRGEQDGKPTSIELKCINYTIDKAETLRLKFGIEVIMVIDGDALPSKKEENAQRREERDKAFEKAMAAEKARDSRAARRFYAQSCSVTHKIRYELIKACKKLGIAFLVAPYEADAQMARLAHTGAVDLVVTEDSDMLVYGCPRALFKVDFDTYQGQEIQIMRDMGENVTPSFRNWTHDMFVFMCIISGCDYCKGVPGIGIKLAHKLVRVHRTPSKIFSALRAAGRMPPDFEEKFWIGFRTFRHQRVFCPSKQQIETLWPITGSNHDASSNEVWPFLGEYIEPRTASLIADGHFHPSKKISWAEALKSHHRNSMPTKLDGIEIHRRTSTNGKDQNQRGANREKSNVWHTLVYGSNDGDVHDQKSKHDEKDNEHHRQSTQNNGSKREMFSFFPQNKKKGKGDAADERDKPASPDGQGTHRPPLQEIYVGTDSNSQPKSSYAPPAHHKDIPIHFNEYASRLVGKAFKPISRKRRKQENDGTKSSKYVQKIWKKCAEVQVPEQEEQPKEDKEVEKKTEGVSLFKKDDIRVFASDRYDYGYDDTHTRGDVTRRQDDNVKPSFFAHTDDPRQNCYEYPRTGGVQAYEDTSVHPSHRHREDLPQSQFHSSCYKDSNVEECNLFEDLQSFQHDQYGMEETEVFNVLKTTVKKKRNGESRHNHTDDHVDSYGQASHVPYGQASQESHVDSYGKVDWDRSCSDKRTDLYNCRSDSNMDHLVPQDHAEPNPGNNCSDNYSYKCKTSHDQYGVEDDDTAVFNVLKTTMKQKRSDSYMDHMDPQDHVEPDPVNGCSDNYPYNCKTSHDQYGVEDDTDTEVFNVLKTTMKKKRHNSMGHVDPVGYAERSFCGDGGDVYHGGVIQDGMLDTFDLMQQL